MDCTDFLEQLDELALEGPDIVLTSELHDHQTVCEHCRQQFFEIRDAWLMIPAALDSLPIRPEFKSRVMDRIASKPLVLTPSDSSVSTFWKYALAATVLIVLVGGTQLSPHWFRAADPQGEQELKRVQELARQMEKLEELEGAFAAPELRYVSLRSVGPQTRVDGYLVYDFLANEGHFFGYDLVVPEGQSYVLWLLNASREVVGSVPIEVNNDHLGAAIVTLPDKLSDLQEVVVSLEANLTAVSPSSNVRMRWHVGK